jgi:phosphatidylserine/phosphatidylglycerophosphate/cardiolipin synthase-like enzyme
MTEVDLSRYRGRAVLGSAGDIRLDGDDVRPKHAVIALGKNGGGDRVQVLRPIQGPVVVERNGRRMGLVDSWTLADGDVILLGSWRLTYRDLGSRQPGAARPPRRKELVTWLK